MISTVVVSATYECESRSGSRNVYSWAIVFFVLFFNIRLCHQYEQLVRCVPFIAFLLPTTTLHWLRVKGRDIPWQGICVFFLQKWELEALCLLLMRKKSVCCTVVISGQITASKCPGKSYRNWTAMTHCHMRDLLGWLVWLHCSCHDIYWGKQSK